MLKRKILRLISVLAAISLLAVCASSMLVSAEYSGGSGTKKDPYLIKTADDLYNMRNNLSAHYKLAATIDMSGYKTDSKYFGGGFVPIGDDSTKPFTGSFTCDLGSDGLPLYAILNLNIYNKKGELFNHDWYGQSDYPDALGQDPPYFYQTALFGTTDGAGIYNIYVLNATVYSSVVGQHSGRYADGTEGSLISYAAFMDTQSTAILIGEAINTTVSHCAATGSVKGNSSRHGGLIGAITDSNVSDSYADIEVDTGGCWGIGNFAGRIAGSSSVTNCFSKGTLNASLDGYGKMGQHKQNSGSGAGGFVGIVDEKSTIENCWTSVKLTSKTKGNNFYGTSLTGTALSKSGVITNCFSYGEYEGKTSAPAGMSNQDNCYISNATNGLQADFNAASPADISSYFLSLSGWTQGDTYPVLSSVNVVTDQGIYVPGAERQGVEVVAAETPVTNETASTASVADSEEETEEMEDGDTTSEGSVTAVEPAEVSKEELGTVQIALIAILTVMIVAITALTVVMVLNTLRAKPENGEETQEDEALTDETEGEMQDAQ
ncbi:MAG: hypothetical protein IJ470_03960 [Clostridia bacterium]|nr:hypothetical protein [Clostridia bacterium]